MSMYFAIYELLFFIFLLHAFVFFLTLLWCDIFMDCDVTLNDLIIGVEIVLF